MLDLNLDAGLDSDDGLHVKVESLENGGARGFIDLNLTVVVDDDDDDEPGQRSQGGDPGCSGKETEEVVRGFDLNIGIDDDSLVLDDEDVRPLVDASDRVKHVTVQSVCCNGILTDSVSSGDACREGFVHLGDRLNHTPSGVVDGGNVVHPSSEFWSKECSSVAITLSPYQNGNSCHIRKMKAEVGNSSSPPATLMRGTRRMRATAVEGDNSSKVIASSSNDLSSSGVSVVTEDKTSAAGCGEVEVLEALPPALELPPSSNNLDLDGIYVLDVFSIYAFLRSFSISLYLRPFELEDLVDALNSNISNPLLDSIHVSVLKTLRKHLAFLSTEGSKSASACLRNLNWDLLDVVTWPIFMVEYLMMHCSGMKPGLSLASMKLFGSDYYMQPAEVKIEVLRCLCDDILEADSIRSELNKRSTLAGSVDFERNTNNDVYIKKGSSKDAVVGDKPNRDTSDWNSDECCLCRMDGSLICCDSCPAAYHARCVGVVPDLLPEGEWFCPECTVGRQSSGNKPQNFVRGAEPLGVDPYGRLYFSCCGYLLVSDSSDAESSFRYYNRNDLNSIIEILQSSELIFGSISSAISECWALQTGYDQEKSSSGSVYHTSDSSSLVSDSYFWFRKKSRGCFHTSSPSKSEEEALLQMNMKHQYYNNYSFAQTASLVAEELTHKSLDKFSQEFSNSVDKIASIQLKVILKKWSKFCWPDMLNLDAERQKANCGWCCSCRCLVEDRDCLFNMNNTDNSTEDLKTELAGLQLKGSENNHLIDVIICILSMEDRLQGLLLGPWLNPHYSNLWRTNILKGSDLATVKWSLLMLVANLHPHALSAEWLKHTDSVITMGSASHVVINSCAASKLAFSRKKGQAIDLEPTSRKAIGGLRLLWWRGGRISRQLFNWKVLPRSLALRAARKGGCVKIPGILYSCSSENARRNKRDIWHAAVEASRSVEQLALQVRDIDLNIRWDDIENNHLLSTLDKECTKSIRIFKKVTVRRKAMEGKIAKYLLDFGKRRCIPEVVMRHGEMVEDSNERKKYWLDESYLPLHLLKSFEEKRIARMASYTSSNKTPHSEVMKRLFRKNVFDYLVSRAERAEKHQCGHCRKDVPIRDAVSCQYCSGFFHRRHAKMLSAKNAANRMYVCHRCLAGKLVVIGKRVRKKKLQISLNSKILKVGRRGRERRVQMNNDGSGGVAPHKRGRPKSKEGMKTSSLSRQVQVENSGKGKADEWPLRSQRSANMSPIITLRRSSRMRKPLPGQYSRLGEDKKEIQTKSRNMSSKKPQGDCAWKKKRTPVFHSFWINGLKLSRKPSDECAIRFKRRKLLPSEFSTAPMDQPKCSLCCEGSYRSALKCIACEKCGGWFHGDALGLDAEKIERLIGFRCHLCLRRDPPVCPYSDDANTEFSGKSSEEVGIPVETNASKRCDSDEVYQVSVQAQIKSKSNRSSLDQTPTQKLELLLGIGLTGNWATGQGVNPEQLSEEAFIPMETDDNQQRTPSFTRESNGIKISKSSAGETLLTMFGEAAIPMENMMSKS